MRRDSRAVCRARNSLSARLVTVELAESGFVLGGVLEQLRREAARAGVEGGSRFALFDARAGGELGVGAAPNREESQESPKTKRAQAALLRRNWLRPLRLAW